jgi:hypothetical protein
VDQTLTRPPVGHPDDLSPTLDLTPFLGVWQNTNPSSAGIACVHLTRRGDTLVARVFGTGLPAQPQGQSPAQTGGHVDWGETLATTFAERPDLREAATFAASYQFGFMDVQLHAWIKLGVLVIAKFDRFTDDSGRSSRFSREFFFQAPD